MASLDRRVAIVTGASRGIGRAIAHRLAAEGAAVAVVARDDERIATAVDELRAGGADAIGVAGDVADERDAERYVAATIEAFGRVDILVNNAGVIDIAPLLETSVETWDRVLAVNARGVFLGCREVAKRLVEQNEGGRIVNIASGAGRQGGPSAGAYAASKFAVIGLTQSAAAELAPYAITVNAVCPGHVTSTAMWDHIDAEVARQTGAARGDAKQTAVQTVPMRRSGTPAEVAAAVAFLVSDDASFVTGESLVVDGGLLRH